MESRLTTKEIRDLMVIQSRLGSYKQADLVKHRDMLVTEWRRAYPEAANEQSDWFHPLLKIADYEKAGPDEPDEIWHNDIYNVCVRRNMQDRMFGTKRMVQLGISSIDGTARHDWRDFQKIKNQLAGPEVEGVELYPAESRLLDPSNYYSIWCFPHIGQLRIGHAHGEVKDAGEAFSPQRALAREK